MEGEIKAWFGKCRVLDIINNIYLTSRRYFRFRVARNALAGLSSSVVCAGG
jgi:hypothetical protein